MKRKATQPLRNARKKQRSNKTYSLSVASSSLGIKGRIKRQTSRAARSDPETTNDGSSHSSSKLDTFSISYPRQHKNRHDEGKFTIISTYTSLAAAASTGVFGYNPTSKAQLDDFTDVQVSIPPLFTLEGMLDVKQWTGPIVASFSPQTIFQSKNPVNVTATIFEIDQNNAQTGSAMLPLATGVELANQGFQRVLHLKSVTDAVTYTNFSNIGCRIKVVWYLCNNNTNKLPCELMNDSTLAMRPQGVYPFFNHVNAATVMGPGFPFSGFLSGFGSAITDAKYFPLMNKFWKPIKVKHFQLQPGDNHELKYKVSINKYIHKQNLVTAFTPQGDLNAPADVRNLYMKGITCVPVTFIVPHNVTDTANEVNSMSRTTTGPYSVGTTTNRVLEFGFVNQKVNSPMQYLQNNLIQNAISASTQLFDVDDERVAVDITLP